MAGREEGKPLLSITACIPLDIYDSAACMRRTTYLIGCTRFDREKYLSPHLLVRKLPLTLQVGLATTSCMFGGDSMLWKQHL